MKTRGIGDLDDEEDCICDSYRDPETRAGTVQRDFRFKRWLQR